MVFQTLEDKGCLRQSLMSHQKTKSVEKAGCATRLGHSGDASHFSVLTRDKGAAGSR